MGNCRLKTSVPYVSIFHRGATRRICNTICVNFSSGSDAAHTSSICVNSSSGSDAAHMRRFLAPKN
ncbi:MAG TPA: hypothetical protein PLI57_11475 [Spirochaetota bacterium]|nr:hypothetical protein [Spirochaetota bacterium]